MALTFIDYDAVPVCGFPWIHWLACDILPIAETIEIPQDASRVATEIMTQGKNSTYGSDKTGKIINGYVGPAPPDKDHEYLLTVYALDTELNLPTGFFSK